MTLAFKFLAGALALYLAIAALAYFGQRRLMYFPHGGRVTPESVGLTGVRERILATSDGQRLIAWHAPPPPGGRTILYFHGNGGSLALRADRIARYQSRGYGMLMLSYRGYSGSTGSPTEAANVADGLLAYDTLRREGVRAEDIVIYGESLGTGVGVQVAAARPVGALVLESPFTATVDIGAEQYPFLPVRWLTLDRYETLRHIKGVTAPVLILHGERDTIIPLAHGRRVFAAASMPKELRTFPNGGHSNLDSHGAHEVVAGWLSRR